MAEDLQDRINSLKAKITVLMSKYAALEADRQKLRQELELTRKAIALRDETIARNERTIEYLRAAVAVNPDRDDVERTRSLITRLVREIDQCILDLTD